MFDIPLVEGTHPIIHDLKSINKITDPCNVGMDRNIVHVKNLSPSTVENITAKIIILEATCILLLGSR